MEPGRIKTPLIPPLKKGGRHFSAKTGGLSHRFARRKNFSRERSSLPTRRLVTTLYPSTSPSPINVGRGEYVVATSVVPVSGIACLEHSQMEFGNEQKTRSPACLCEESRPECVEGRNDEVAQSAMAPEALTIWTSGRGTVNPLSLYLPFPHKWWKGRMGNAFDRFDGIRSGLPGAGLPTRLCEESRPLLSGRRSGAKRHGARGAHNLDLGPRHRKPSIPLPPFPP